MNHETPGQQWRCSNCQALLGIERDGELELKYRTASFIVRGVVTARCRRCGVESRRSTALGAADREAQA